MMNTSYVLWQENDGIIIRSLEYPVVTQGANKEEAIASLKEAVELYLEDEVPAETEPQNVEFGKVPLYA